MAQKRYLKFGQPLNSWVQDTELHMATSGSGRLCGFDSIMRTGALTFRVNVNTDSSPAIKDYNGTALPPNSIWVTQQGVIVSEDTDRIRQTVASVVTDFTIANNTAGNFTRYDAVVGTHSYSTTGEIEATYRLIAGDASLATDTGINLPAVGDVYRDTIIGYLKVPVGATDINDCTWYPMPSVNSGHKQYSAKLDTPNLFMGIQQESASATEKSIYDSGDGNGYWSFERDGNQFTIRPGGIDSTMKALYIKDMPFIPGTKITLKILGNGSYALKMRHNATLGTPEYDKGYRPLYIPERFANFYDSAFVGDGGEYTISNMKFPGTNLQTNILIELEAIDYNIVSNLPGWQVTNVVVQNLTTPRNHRGHGAWRWDCQLEDLSAPVSTLLTMGTVALYDFNLPFVVWDIFNPSWGKKHTDNVSLKVLKTGTFKFDVKACLKAEFTDSASLTHAYAGAADVAVVLLKDDGSTVMEIALGSSGNLRPYAYGHTAVPCNLYPEIAGGNIVEAQAGDLLTPMIRINYYDTTVTFLALSGSIGQCSFTGTYLGEDFKA